MPASNITYFKNTDGHTFKLEVLNDQHPSDLDDILEMIGQDKIEVINQEYYFAPDPVCIKVKGRSGHVANLYHDSSLDSWKNFGKRDSLYIDLYKS